MVVAELVGMKERLTTQTARWGGVIAFFILAGNGFAASENLPVRRDQFLLLHINELPKL